jgi:hypothetical protein
MSREVTIPKCRNPFVVIINGIKYTYQSGETVELPDEVAEVIEFHVNSKPRPDPNAGKSDSIVFVPFEITENGTCTSPEGEAYSPIIVNVKESGGDDTIPADKYFEGGYAEVVLPNATKIGKYKFQQDTTLTSIETPNATVIDSYAFKYCEKLTSISFPKVVRIENEAFPNCVKLALTSLPEGLTHMGSSAFSNCQNLALTELPSGITSISNSTFSSCSSLISISLPKNLKTIATYAFINCTGLNSITFKGTPTNVDSKAFQNCTNLTTINVPWAEGWIAGAPWGGTNATINYNYKGE